MSTADTAAAVRQVASRIELAELLAVMLLAQLRRRRAELEALQNQVAAQAPEDAKEAAQ